MEVDNVKSNFVYVCVNINIYIYKNNKFAYCLLFFIDVQFY